MAKKENNVMTGPVQEAQPSGKEMHKSAIQKLELLEMYTEEKEAIEAGIEQYLDSMIPEDIREKIAAARAEFKQEIEGLDKKISILQAEVKEIALFLETSIMTETISAIYSKPRVTWDSKALEGFMVAHPEISAFRKTGNPSVSFRRSKKDEE